MLLRVILGIIILLGAAAIAASFLLARPIFNETLEQKAFERLSLAPLRQAVTLALTTAGEVLLITAADNTGISGIDVGSATNQEFNDVIDAYDSLGIRGLQALYGSPESLSLPWDSLTVPLTGKSPHIAVGANYRAHAEEVGLENEPFLFPKLSQPSAWNADVIAGPRLDHEVELCAVPLSEHSQDNPSRLGYLLCGDFTERMTLIQEIDFDQDMGHTGFAEAKGGPSRLPVGPFLLVPFSEDFYQEIELSLYVNKDLRQRSDAGLMVWPPREILSRILAECRTPYQFGERSIRLSGCESIPAGTLILTGTPEGVMFNLLTLWNPLSYLQEGDQVTSFGSYLGLTRNRVVADDRP